MKKFNLTKNEITIIENMLIFLDSCGGDDEIRDILRIKNFERPLLYGKNGER